MKTKIASRKPANVLDYIALSVTTFGVGYLPFAPGTFGSIVGVLIYFGVSAAEASFALWIDPENANVLKILAWTQGINLVAFLLFCLLGIWAAGRSTQILGDLDPPEAVVDEVIGQLIAFLFVPTALGWHYLLAGFLFFRLFDIWKPYPIDYLQSLPGGVGVCADDILAGVYAGVCLALFHAIMLSI